MRTGWWASALAFWLATAGSAPAADRALARAALELDTWEGLTEMVEVDLGNLSEALQARDFSHVSEWFTDDFRGASLMGAVEKSTRQRFAFVTRHAPGPLLDRTRWLSELTGILAKWSRVDSIVTDVPAARFDDAGGRAAVVSVELHAQGALSGERPVALSASFDGQMRFQLDRYRFKAISAPRLSVTTAEAFLYSEVSASVGVAAETTSPLDLDRLMGGWQGAGVSDVNGDGLPDLFVASVPTNHLYIQQGDGTFTDEAKAAGVSKPAGATGVLFVDLDNDGSEDLLLGLPDSGVHYFRNMGGVFREATGEAGLAQRAQTYSLTSADIDGNGFLDVYACSYNTYGKVAPNSWTAATNGTPSLLFVSQMGHFQECAKVRGVADGRWSYATAFGDCDGNGSPDLFVANDYGENGLYVNDGHGHFTDSARARGVNGPGEAMGVDWGDFDGDGRADLFVTNIASIVADRVLSRVLPAAHSTALYELARGNALYLNRPGRFSDARRSCAVDRGGWAWGGGFLDVDNDGWLDIFSTNGFLSGANRRETASTYWRHVLMSSLPVPATVAEPPANSEYLIRQFGPVKYLKYSFAGHERDRLYRNTGGSGTEDVTAVSGCDDPQDGRAAVFWDYDNDGGVDIFVHDIAGARQRLFHNQAPRGNWVRVELVGTRSNRDAVGARIEAQVGRRTLTRWVSAGSGFISSHDRRLTIGLAKAHQIDRLRVHWPTGATQEVRALQKGRAYRIVEN
jgi:hypothetical protein